MTDIRLLVSDVDGTLAYERSLVSPLTRHWVERAVNERHLPFYIVSGRPTRGIRVVARQFAVPVGICAFNGNYISSPEGKLIYERPADWDQVREVIRISKQHDVDCVLFDDHDWFVDPGSHLYPVQLDLFGFDGFHQKPLLDLVDEFEHEDHKIYKCIPKTLDPEKAGMIKGVLMEKLGSCMDIYSSSPYVVETMPKGSSKGRAVDELCRFYGISPRQVMAFGDYDNDLDMIQKSGYGVAMGNALPRVKEAAWYVTDSNKDDGVAHAIERFCFEAS